MTSTNTTRRYALGAIAVAAIVPSTALGSGQADPIFAAIAAWREAQRVHAEEHEKNGWDGRGRETCDAYHDAAMQMAETVPATLAGMAALLEIAAHDIEMGDAAWQPVAVWTTAAAIRARTGGEPLYISDPEQEDGDEDEDTTKPKTGSIVLDHFETQAPAPHIALAPFHDGKGWCIKAQASGYEPLLFGCYADSEKTAHWAAEQVAVHTGCTVPPLEGVRT